MAKEDKVSKSINIDQDLMTLVERLTTETTQDYFSDFLESDEKDRQAALKDRIDNRGLHASDDNDLDEAEDDKDSVDSSKEKKGSRSEPESTNVVTPKDDEIHEASFDDIIDQLNMMRSGRSTKDKDVKDRLKTYITGLTPGERQSLFVFLIGLTGILTSGTDPVTAPDPSSIGIKVQAKRKPADSQPTNIAKKAVKPEDSPNSGTAAVPIIVGEVADKREVRRKLAQLLRS